MMTQIEENIGPLINTVVATNKFEKEMATLFGGAAGGIDEEVRRSVGRGGTLPSEPILTKM